MKTHLNRVYEGAMLLTWFALSGFGHAADPAGERTWSLSTRDTKVTIAVDADDHLTLREIVNPKQGWNWAAKPAVIALPTQAKVAGAANQQSLRWTFQAGKRISAPSGDTVTVTFVCAELPTLTLSSAWWASSATTRGPVQHTFVLNNSGPAAVALFPLLEGLDINVAPDKSAELWTFNKDGGPGPDRIGTYREPMTENTHLDKPLIVKNHYGFIPMMVLSVEERHGLYLGWECQTGRLHASRSGSESAIRLQAGYIGGQDVPKDHLLVPAKGTFTLSSAYLGVYAGDLDVGMNGFKRWFWDFKVPANLRQDPREPWTQFGGMFHYAKGWGSREDVFTKAMQEKLSDLPFESVEIDHSWWGKDFESHPEKWPTGIKTASTLAHQNGYKFNLYFFKWVNWNTKEKLKEKYIEYNLDCWRSDFCRVDIPTLDWLAANIPNYRWESCDCGAAWKDFATLRRATVQAPTDVYDALSVRKAFYDSSWVIPPAQLINLLEWRGPSDADFPIALRSTMTGAIWWGMCDGNPKVVLPSDLPKKIQPMKENLMLYKEKLRPLVRTAEIYHILPRPDGKRWDGIEFFDPVRKTGAVLLFKPGATPDKQSVVLKGLDPGQAYEVRFTDRPQQNLRATGAELMQTGVAVTLTEKNQSEIIFIDAVAAIPSKAP